MRNAPKNWFQVLFYFIPFKGCLLCLFQINFVYVKRSGLFCAEQRQNMRNISRGERTKTNLPGRAGQKRKYQSSEKQSVKAAAKDFLEKAAREILGDTSGGIKGPLQVDMSEDDDNNQPLS